jgi:hypothetical protein
MEIHIAELSVSDPNPFEVEIAVTNFKMPKSAVIKFWQN